MAYTSEIEKLEQRFRENPKGRNFAPLADAYRKGGLIDNAIELCQTGIKLHPDYISAHIVYGRCLIDKKDDPAAEEVFRKILQLDQENILALKVLAEIADRNKRFDQEVEWLSRLLSVDPMNGEAAEALSRARKKASSAKPVEPVAAPPLGMEPTALAEAPTAAMGKPDFVVEQASAPEATVPTKSAPSGDVEAFDGTVDFNATAHEAAKAAGIEVQEDVELKVDAVPLEGLARTQYEGSGMPDIPDTMEDLPSVDLPLIMPEDVTPRRSPPAAAPPPPPSPPPVPRRTPPPAPAPVPAAVAASDDDGAADTAALSMVEPVVTETMAELYLKQGHREDALRVYEALLARHPGDARLRAKVNALSPGRPGKGGGKSGQSVGAFLRSVLAGAEAREGMKAPVATEPGGGGASTPTLDGAFAGTEDPGPGAPTRPAADSISLDSVFGDVGEGGDRGRASLAPVGPPAGSSSPAPTSTPAPTSPAPGAAAGEGGGFSFDEFFSAPSAPAAASPPPAAEAPPGQKDSASPPPRVSGGQPRSPENEGELDHFQAWLKGLKS